MAASNMKSSIKSGATAADRRVVAGAAAATTPPATSSDGIPCAQSRWLHIVGKVNGAAALTADYFVMGYDAVADEWVLLESVGTAGTRGLNTTTAPRAIDTVEVSFAFDRIAVVVDAIDVGATLDVWVSTSGT